MIVTDWLPAHRSLYEYENGVQLMGTTVIPWHVFLEGLKKVPEGSRRDAWLQRWRFNEEGAVLIKDTRELEKLSGTASKVR